MNEIARDHFPEEARVVVEWKGGERDTPIRFTVGPISGELPTNTPTIMPTNIAQVIAEGHNVTVAAAPEGYQAARDAIDESANHPGGAGDAGTMKVLDGPGGAPATVTSVDPAMVGGSINGGAEGSTGDPTDYPNTESRAMVDPDAANVEGAAGEDTHNTDTAEGGEGGEGGETDSSEVLDKAKELQGKTVGKIEEAIAAGVELPVLKAALTAEQSEGPAKERSGAVGALQKAIEQHPDNKAS